MEEQILHYYLKNFSFILVFLLILFLFSFYIFINKEISLKNKTINVNKGEKLGQVLKNNIVGLSNLEIKLIKIYFKIINILNKNYIHYGEFNFNNNSSLFDFINIISKPSNMSFRITIIEGWSKNQLNLELSKHFSDFHPIPYEDIIADTYFVQKNYDFKTFLNKLKKIKTDYFKNYKNNNLLEFYDSNQIMIIGSLVEKEGLDNDDKKQISSVIYNRLNKDMKLQIDATVLFAITNGNYDLERKILIRDLKTDHPYNTYIYKGLPPTPISYVGKKTLDILFENNKNDFLFYFFNYSLNRHIFSKTFQEHKEKLNEYRKK